MNARIAPQVNEATAGQVPEVLRLIRAVFREHVAPLYSPEGVAQFEAYASAALQTQRLASGHSLMVAVDDRGRITGAAEVREPDHLSMLFVETAHQREGVGRALLAAVVERCRARSSTLVGVTVHASPNSVEAYRRLGFVPRGGETTDHGIRFVPMVLRDFGGGGA